MTPKNVNPCGVAYLYLDGHVCGQTIDTPNAIAYAMLKYGFDMVKTYYPLFPPESRGRECFEDRFDSVREQTNLGDYIKIY